MRVGMGRMMSRGRDIHRRRLVHGMAMAMADGRRRVERRAEVRVRMCVRERRRRREDTIPIPIPTLLALLPFTLPAPFCPLALDRAAFVSTIPVSHLPLPLSLHRPLSFPLPLSAVVDSIQRGRRRREPPRSDGALDMAVGMRGRSMRHRRRAVLGGRYGHRRGWKLLVLVRGRLLLLGIILLVLLVLLLLLLLLLLSPSRLVLRRRVLK